MDSKKLIELIDLKDKYACALFDSQLDGIEEGQVELNLQTLQKYVDDVCAEWAMVFVCRHQELFNDRQTRIDIYQYLNSIGAKSGHTGKRFSEALYKQLHYFYSHNRAKQNKHNLSK